MVRHDFIPQHGRYYKANLHCHSSISDGKLSPDQLKAVYKEHGYSVLCITDHDALFAHPELNDECFLTLNGYEMEIDDHLVHGEGYDHVHTCHLCLYARDPENTAQVCFDPDFQHPIFRWCSDPELKKRLRYAGEPMKATYDADCINKIIDTANKHGFIVTLNHLQWSQEPYEQFSKYKGLFAMEIFNTGSYQSGICEHNGILYDQLLHLGNRLFCVAADDNHNRLPINDPKSDSFGGFVMIKARSLEYGEIFGALEKGNFYSSCGPHILELFYAEGKICVKTDKVVRIRLVTDNRYSRLERAKDGEKITYAEFCAKRINRYFRVEIEDEKGKKAYSNAYYISEIGNI